MTARGDTRRKPRSFADRAWCRLVMSSAGDQVLGVYKARPALAQHLASCEDCQAVASDYERLAVRFGEMQHSSFVAPPDFVDSVLSHLEDHLAPIPRRRPIKEKAALAGAAALSAAVLAVAAVAHRRHAAAP